MAQTASLQIDRLTVTGFGCFAEEHSWDFGRMTMITGHNFQGKSTIADAIAYASRMRSPMHSPARRSLAAGIWTVCRMKARLSCA